ncbi:MAG: MAPEG family protein [Spongiibacteraceae bacterium]
MTTLLWCLLVACLMPIVLAGMGGYFKKQQFGALDNNNPRAQSALLTGTGARVVAAQGNAWEALAIFTAAVLVVQTTGVDAAKTALVGQIFIAARVAHAFFYIRDIDILRSLSFMVGLGCCICLFVMAA